MISALAVSSRFSNACCSGSETDERKAKLTYEPERRASPFRDKQAEPTVREESG
jgi:hypothetical protein